MDIYFAGSIRGGRSDASLYAELISMLQEHGTVLTEHVGAEEVEKQETNEAKTDREIHDEDIEWLQQADVVVAEVTNPSLGVGYELGRATEWGTPILCLFRPDGEHDLSAMVRGNSHTEVVEYEQPADVTETLASFVSEHR